MIRLLRRGLTLTALLLAAMLASVTGLVHSYHRLSAETLIAELSFEQLGPQHYSARLASGDLCRHYTYRLHGDQWRVDAEFLKWKPWANLLGLDARYRLDRLEGRYVDVEQQNHAPGKAWSLAQLGAGDLADNWLLRQAASLVTDASYGSSTYQTIDPGRIYQVYKTQSGLITRSRPLAPERDSDGVLIIRIDRACPSA